MQHVGLACNVGAVMNNIPGRMGIHQGNPMETNQRLVQTRIDYALPAKMGTPRGFGLNGCKYTTIVVQKPHLLLTNMNIHLTRTEKEEPKILTQQVHPSN